MKATSTISLSAAALLLSATSGVQAADQAEVNFLTALVDDYQAHKTEYIKFLATATSIPLELATIATQVLTYTDHSYTTLLDNPDLDFGKVESFASELPWYTRLELEADGSASATPTSRSTSDSTTSHGDVASASADESSTEGGQSETESNGHSTTQTGNTLTTSRSQTTATTGSQTNTRTTTHETSTTTGGANGLLAPFGAAVGLAIALL
ncbi:TIR3 [[Candida] subhashii]|uniref:TIR3 n=1 Tax=[Candida] subhashii TaxID=561895 RepID=A0A8J5V591_9ASCO|nr:TIR3 [[Candida] subhashii]KAG7665809.1 TIR3 [[Candida] subhashii]